MLVTLATHAFVTATADDEDALVTGGPYRMSRNPMYLGWTLMYVGYCIRRNTSWPLVCLPPVIAITHQQITDEELELETTYGETYRAYRRRVPRYL